MDLTSIWGKNDIPESGKPFDRLDVRVYIVVDFLLEIPMALAEALRSWVSRNIMLFIARQDAASEGIVQFRSGSQGKRILVIFAEVM